jgi:membrane protease YdiL (CAAX protease family)
MVISALLISTPVIGGWLLSGHKISTIYLQGSKKMWGILVGIGGLLLLGGLGVFQANSSGLAFTMILAAIPMALVFSFANGFREELVYRAIFLDNLQANIGVLATIIVTTLVFAVAHIEVSYDPASLVIFIIVLILIGVVGSLIMMKTGSLIGAVLFHAGADVLLIMGLLSSQQLILK